MSGCLQLEATAALFSPCRLLCADEKLGPVGVWPSVGHRQDAGASVGKLEVLVSKLVAVDGFSPGSIVVGEVTALCDKKKNVYKYAAARFSCTSCACISLHMQICTFQRFTRNQN